MGMLGTFLGLDRDQERKLLINIRKFAEEMDPDAIKREIGGYAKKVNRLHTTSNRMLDTLNILAIYTKNKDPEGWKKAAEEYAVAKKTQEEEIARREAILQAEHDALIQPEDIDKTRRRWA